MSSCTAARTDIAAPSRALLLSAEPGQVKKDAAAMVLQRLLRGRAMQTRMYEGLQTKIALIRVTLMLHEMHKDAFQKLGKKTFLSRWQGHCKTKALHKGLHSNLSCKCLVSAW